MADRRNAVRENVEGSFFVDTTCIDCDTCRQLAPDTFGETGEFSFVKAQPGDPCRERAALHALVACPTGSIGTSGQERRCGRGTRFPAPARRRRFLLRLQLAKILRRQFLFRRAPRRQLADRFTALCGTPGAPLCRKGRPSLHLPDPPRRCRRCRQVRRTLRLYAHHPSPTNLPSQPDAERVIDGFEPVELAPDFLAIPTPGHTRGHCALLHREFLFTGDHLWWSRNRGRLTASRDVCWYSWPEQVRSVARLKDYRFEWVLPGHGERAHFPADEMCRQLQRLMDTLAAQAL